MKLSSSCAIDRGIFKGAMYEKIFPRQLLVNLKRYTAIFSNNTDEYIDVNLYRKTGVALRKCAVAVAISVIDSTKPDETIF
jgi:hypothetical protein